jgi:2-polyprenyl-6-methoxyphenol hydroxylase-like FAD-dependent oxidoreductase
MMAGFLMARAGVETVVLEKHGDFLRDFRDDTVHPSSLEIFNELNLLNRFLERPHERMPRIGISIGGRHFDVGDFSGLPVAARYIAFMPQWEFLDFIADEARKLPTFTLLMNARAKRLIERDGRIAGLVAATPDGDVAIDATLTIAADGRGSDVRRLAGMVPREIGAPIDVLWFAIPRNEDDGRHALLNVGAGAIIVTIDRGDYWQCARVIPKGGLGAIRSRGLDAFRADVAAVVPHLSGGLEALASWDEIKLLSVAIDRLDTWHRPGLLCIGDAAHAMSPIGGVGINLAVQDPVATANILAAKLADGSFADADLPAVQQRRAFPAKAIQFVQSQAQQRVLSPILRDRTGAVVKAPLPLRLVSRLPFLQRLAGRMLGLGVRPEHVRSPDAFRSA